MRDSTGKGMGRHLSAAEQELWSFVMRDVKQLFPVSHPYSGGVGRDSGHEAGRRVVRMQCEERNGGGEGRPVPSMEKRIRDRIARGRYGIDAILDLHGMRYCEAERAVQEFLCKTDERGEGIVLIVTGKGDRGADEGWDSRTSGVRRGILWSAVREWLTMYPCREWIVSNAEAAPCHGGGGAIYVQLRGLRGLSGRMEWVGM